MLSSKLPITSVADMVYFIMVGVNEIFTDNDDSHDSSGQSPPATEGPAVLLYHHEKLGIAGQTSYFNASSTTTST